MRMGVIVLLFLAFAIANPVQAATIDLPRSGQVQCFSAAGSVIPCDGTGQDGEYQAGLPWPQPRFVTGPGAETECITDRLTGLMWTRSANMAWDYTPWQEALDFVKNLNLTGYCGHSDWRLPNILELESLLPGEEPDVEAWLTDQGFTNVWSECYWSSTTSEHYYPPLQYNAKAWVLELEWGGGITTWVKFPQGRIDWCFLWPVRSGSTGTISLPKTGQTRCYDESGVLTACTGTDQDGELQVGTAWPSPHYTEDGECVTDNLTGLMWAKSANIPNLPKTWSGALSYADDFELCGYSDWRLPNIKELRSLIDFSRYDYMLPYSDAFREVQPADYWTSTTRADYPDSAWTVNMRSGEFYGTNSQTKAAEAPYTWPVRGGKVNQFADLLVSKTGSGAGTVTSSPPGIDCGSDCSESFELNTAVTLTATPGPSSVFGGWSGGGCTGLGACVVTLTADTTVTAAFSKPTFTLTVVKSGVGSGTVTSSPPGISCGADCSEGFSPGTVVTLSAVAQQGSVFDGWSGGGCSGTGSCAVTLNSHLTVTATFSNPIYTLSVTKTGTGSGTVTSSPSGISCGADCSEEFTPGTIVTLSAVPQQGSTFDGWSGGGCSGTGACVVTMAANIAVTAGFTQVCAYTISPSEKTFSSFGGSVNVTVSATGAANCPEPPIAEDLGWITVTVPTWQANKGTVKIAASQHSGSVKRTGIVSIGGSPFAVNQTGPACRIVGLYPSSQSFAAAGGTGSFVVNVAPQDCSWQAAETPDVEWVGITGGSGTGNGSVAYAVGSNGTGLSRTAKITAALTSDPLKKRVFTIRQAR